MTLLKKARFVCVDCEATGLDPKNDRIIEVAGIDFTLDGTIATYESLIDPEIPIPAASTDIHNITDNMITGKPKIADELEGILNFIGQGPLIGHSIGYDIELLANAASRANIPHHLHTIPVIDTLRLARLYGESPSNSLEALRKHFNITAEGAHRAMSDVIVNIQVFKHLVAKFTTLEQILERLKRPILLSKMPLGKHKGRPFNEIPIEYLQWARHQNFDLDLSSSIQNELKKRKKGHGFNQAINPFGDL
ncbi:MAG: DUF3820 family protein [Chlamydiales bacterium]|nr:DUF3820 family protein [Chlamydiales bacterium]